MFQAFSLREGLSLLQMLAQLKNIDVCLLPNIPNPASRGDRDPLYRPRAPSGII